VLELFLDQGIAMNDFESAKELLENARFWETEKKLGKLAQDVMKNRLISIQPYDLFNIEPASYNMSIEREGGKGDQAAKARKAKEEKRKKMLERKAQGPEDIGKMLKD